MSTSYPSNLDNFSNPTGTDYQDSSSVPHDTQHANLNDAVEAMEAALGILPQGGFASVRLRLEDIEGDVAALGSSIVATMLDNSIAGSKLINGAVTETKLADNIISSAKLKTGSVSSDKIVDLAISSGKIASDAITYDKVGNSNKMVLTRAASQSLGGTSSAYISWDTKVIDTEGYVAAVPNTTITIPAAKAGLCLIVATISGFLANANDYLQIEVSTGTVNWKSAGGAAINAVGIADIAVGGTIKVLANNGSASSLSLTGRVHMVKLFDA